MDGRRRIEEIINELNEFKVGVVRGDDQGVSGVDSRRRREEIIKELNESSR